VNEGRPHCPRCAEELKSASYGEVSVGVCSRCKGTLHAQGELHTLFEALTDEFIESVHPDERPQPAPDLGGRANCPRCHNQMSHADYCGAGLVHFHRCDGCRLIWLDANQLEAMAQVWVRMDKHRARSYAEHQARYRDVERFVDLILTYRPH
jgi:Zn-finger nucleic acid-binding protein